MGKIRLFDSIANPQEPKIFLFKIVVMNKRVL